MDQKMFKTGSVTFLDSNYFLETDYEIVVPNENDANTVFCTTFFETVSDTYKVSKRRLISRPE